ncbi:MAG: UDP-N-acetylglucosamine--N-acetylmuramyl-(pentapeptide) pyrophosphoryl-undecaprenol N-acetylglucosamine transferase [Candidatus Paceibacterota bacterium]
MIRILFTGGGTGGHIYPIVAVAEEIWSLITNEQVDFRYFGAPGNYKSFLEEKGIKVSRIFSAKLRRYFDIRNFFDIFFFLPLSFIQALWKVFWFMPDVLFSKGGPGALPVVLACRFYRVPVIIHDSDSIIGLANKLSGRFAQRIAVSFSSAIEDLNQNNPKLAKKAALIGNPIRHSLSKVVMDPQAAKQSFGFYPEKPILLIIGGSQGAVKINNFFVETAAELIKKFQILHQTGIKNFDSAKAELDSVLKELSPEEKKNYKLVPYFEKDMADAYSAADLVISRASSGSIFEIAAFAKPSILIPLPEEVVGVHQTKNAYEYAKAGATVVIEEPNLKQNIFIEQLEKVFSNPETLKSMSAAAKQFSKPEAGKMIAEEIVRMAERG